MKKRVLSLFMALMLCLTLLPTAALAEGTEGTEGTAQTPPAVEKAADPANGEEQQENQPAEQEEQQEDSAAKQAVAAVQAMIDALPAVDELDGMDDDDAMAVYEAFQAACDAYYDTLTEEQQAQLKNTEKLAALSDWFSQPEMLANSGDIFPDTVDADGSIIRDENWSRSGLICEDSNGDASFTDAQFYVVQENDNVTIRGNLTIGGSCALILCQGAKLTVEGALICSGSYSIYGQSDGGAYAGRLVVKNSLDDGAAIRSDSTYPPSLGIYSGELEIHSGNSDKLVDGVKLSSTSHIHQGTLDGTAISPEVWGADSLKGGTLTLAYCQHEHPADQELIPDSGGTAHHRHCKACGFDWASEACDFDNPDHYVPNPADNANTHFSVCECGNVSTTPAKHEPFAIPTDDGKGHTQRCQYCLYTSTENNPVEEHHYVNGECEDCGFKPAAHDATGNLYESVGDAMKAAADGSWVMLETHAEDGGKELSEEIEFNDPGKTVELKMNGYTLTHSGNPTLTVENGTLKITGDATINQTGTFSDLAAPAVKVTGGRVIFEGNLTATGASGKPAVEVTNGTLRLKAGDVLNGGVSVAGSTTYANVNALLGDGLAFAKVGEISAIVKGDVMSISENVTVVAHTHDFKLNSDGKYVCACGYTCPHNNFKDGKCTICGNGCAHTNVDENGLCGNCKTQMAVKSETGGTVTYGTDFAAAMCNATNGTKITLLADVSISGRTGISGDDTTVTLDLNGHKITGGWLDVGNRDATTYTTRTLKIIGKGSYEPPEFGGLITVFVKATLDLSEWEGGTISEISISDNSTYDAETREPAVIVGPKAGTIGKLSFGNNQLGELKKTKLSGGSFNEIWVAGFGPVKLGELLADGYAYQNADGSYVKYETTLQDASIYNVKVVKCLHPNMKPDETGVATCEYCGKSGKFVASVDGNLYTDMDEAISYWLANGGTLKLYADYTAADGTWKVGSGSHTINLNSYRMSVQGDSAFKPANNMHLTVTDGTERGQITNILLDGSQGGSFTLENGYVGNLVMTGGAVVALKGGSVDELDVKNCSVNTNLSIQGGSLGKLNIEDWADGMHVSATGGSLGAYTLPSGKILADVLDHQYYAEGTSLDRQEDTAQLGEKFDIKQAPYDFGSTSKAANVPINGSIPFRVDSPSENVGVYEVKWYRRTNSGAEHMVENKVAGVNVNDTLEVFCVITGVDRPGGEMQWQVAVKGYTIKVVPAKLNGDQTVITQNPGTGNTGNPADNRLVVTPFSSNALSGVEYKFEVTYNRRPLELNKDYAIKDSSNWAMNAGTHTLTIEGMGNYTGEKSVTWTLDPYELSVENFRHAPIDKTYDGTDAVTDSTNGINALDGFVPDSKNPRNPILSTVDVFNLGKSDYQLSNMKFDSAEAGDRTFTGTMTLTSGGNFVFAGGSRVMQIEYSSGRVSVSINRATIAAPAAKALQVANNHAAMYTVDLSALLPALEAPREYGAVTYGAPTVNLSSDYYTDGARVEDGKLILPIRAVETKETGSIGSVKVNVSTTNYHDFTLTINVIAKNRITPTGTPTLSKNAITYGDALNTIALSGKLHDNVNNVDVDGTFEWVDGTHIPVVGNGTYAAEWIFEPTDTEKYLTVSGRSNITVEKAQQYGKVSMAGYTYGQTPSTPTLTDRTGDGSVTYYYSTTNSNSGGTKWENIQADTLNAGTYYMYAELGETENYGSFTTACVKFRVVRAMPTYTAPTGLTAKYGQTLADVTLPNDWSWMDSSESVGGASTAAKKFMAKFTPTDTDNYNMVENIELEVMVNKADGRNLKTVELEQKYTDASEHTYTPDWLGLPSGQTWRYSSEYSVSTGSNVTLTKQDFTADGSLLTYAVSGGKAGDKITLTLKASCDNYGDFTITLNITLTEKDDQKPLTITGAGSVVYGQTLTLTTTGGSGTGTVTYRIDTAHSTGEATIDPNTGVLTPVKIGSVSVIATKAGDSDYNDVTSAPFVLMIKPATPTGEPSYTKSTTSGKTLKDAALTTNGSTLNPNDGKLEWVNDKGNVLPDSTRVEANTTYKWRFTPTDTNYTTLTGEIELWHKSTSSGGGSYYAPVVPDMPMLYRGCTGDAVKTLQEKLNAKGFDSGNVDGIFGAKTYAAATAFQKANGLGVDGIVGKLTWAKLYDATPVNVTPVTTQPMLRTGSRGDAVRKLQELLNAKGYTCGSVDGIFGSKTYAAVLAFQKANGLGADGIVGPLTWGKLV